MISKADDSEKQLPLEEIAATLLEAARKLSPGQDRHEAPIHCYGISPERRPISPLNMDTRMPNRWLIASDFESEGRKFESIRARQGRAFARHVFVLLQQRMRVRTDKRKTRSQKI